MLSNVMLIFSMLGPQHQSSSALTCLLEDAACDQFEGSEDGSFLLQRGGMGGHGAWRDAADVCMVPPAGYEKDRPAHPFLKHLWREKWIQVR